MSYARIDEMTPRLAEKVCVITGATGIAAAAAHRFAAEDGLVFTISVDEDECAALNEALTAEGHDHAWAVADLRDEDAATAAFDVCIERFGRVDALFAVAGGSGRPFGDGAVHEIPLQGWRATLDLNLTTTFLAVREAVRRMLENPTGGAIVVTSSVLTDSPSPDLFATHAYATAKGAQLALVRAAAARYAPDNIRVNAVTPAAVATPMSARAQNDESTAAYVAAKQPLAGGFLSPEDVAAAALFLLSDESRQITGQVIAVDGGWSLTEPNARA